VPNARDIGIRPARPTGMRSPLPSRPHRGELFCHRCSVGPYDARLASWLAYSGGPPLADRPVDVCGRRLIVRRDKTNCRWFAPAHPTPQPPPGALRDEPDGGREAAGDAERGRSSCDSNFFGGPYCSW